MSLSNKAVLKSPKLIRVTVQQEGGIATSLFPASSSYFLLSSQIPLSTPTSTNGFQIKA